MLFLLLQSFVFHRFDFLIMPELQGFVKCPLIYFWHFAYILSQKYDFGFLQNRALSSCLHHLVRLDSVKRINCESDLALAPAHVPMHTSAALCPLNELLLCGRMLRDSSLGDRITRSVSLGFDDTTHIAGHCSTGCICLGNRLFVLRRLLFLLFLASCILH